MCLKDHVIYVPDSEAFLISRVTIINCPMRPSVSGLVNFKFLLFVCKGWFGHNGRFPDLLPSNLHR